jgi:hypothetical protein
MKNKQLTSLRNQISIINNVHVAMIHPHISNNLLVSLRTIFGLSLTTRLLQCVERIQRFSYDPILLKVLLIIITFTSGDCRARSSNYCDLLQSAALTIWAAQNSYVELLWKYIRSRSSNELQAVKVWSKLTSMLLYLQDVHYLIEEHVNQMPNEIAQIEPLIQKMWPIID